MSETYTEPELIAAKHRHIEAYLFLAPALLLLAVFFVYPVLWMFRVSVSEYEPVTGAAKTVAHSYYREVLSSAATWRSILNTAYFAAVYIPFTLALAGAIALLLNRCVRSRPILRVAFCAPCIIPAVAAALIWRAAYQPSGGAVDRVFDLLGYTHGRGWAGWLAEPYLAMPCIALMCVWRDAGLFALILLAAVARVPKGAYELAESDGATKWETFRYVTLPMCLGTVGLCTIMLVINVQNVFQEIYVMTEDGGPANWTVNIPFLVYHNAYMDYDWGHATALSSVLFAVTVVLILVQNRLLNRRLDWK
jgi:multiple sugar transport system permease protein